MTSETEAAWSAGFFDGEGSIFVSHRKGYLRPSGKYQTPYTLPCVSIHQVRIEPLERFMNCVGVGTINGPYKGTGLGIKPCYQWSNQGKIGAITVAKVLWPYMSPPKKEQFHRVWDELRELLTARTQNFEELPI